MTATLEKTSPNKDDAGRVRLLARLAHIRRKIRLRLLIEGTALLLAEIAAAALLTFLADHTFRLGVAARIALLILAIAFLLVELYRRVITILRIPLDPIALAGALGRAGNQPTLAARVATVLELPSFVGTTSGASPVMIDRAIARAQSALDAIHLDTFLDRERLKKMLALALAAILIPALLALLFHATASLWARRLFLASREPWPQNTYLEVADVQNNRISVPRGEPYVLRAKARDGSVTPARILLTIRSTDRTTALMKEFAKNDFRHDFAVIDQPLDVEFEGGDDDLGPISIIPVDRPRIVSLDLSSQHPRQPAPELHAFTGGDADLSFLTQTKLQLTLAANVPLSAVRLHAQSPLPTEANLHKIDSTHFTIQWTQTAAAKFDLEMVAADSGLVSLPVPISIGLKVDQPPRITMAYSGVRPRITARAKIPLAIDARDDFGVVSAELALKDETPDPADPAKLIPHETTRPLFPQTTTAKTQPAAAPAGETLLQLKPAIDVAPMQLPTGSLLSITAHATDDCYTGPQTARSGTVTFRIVAPEELFREILQRQQAERVKFRKQMEEAIKISDALKSPAVDAKSTAELSRRHRAFQRETLRIAGVLTDAFREMQLNSLGSPEAQSLMQNNVLTPMKSLQDDLISPQAQALDALAVPSDASLDPAKIQPAAAREDQIAASMKIILQQMAQWDSFVDVLNQLDGIIKLETQVKDTSEKLQHKDTEDLFDK